MSTVDPVRSALLRGCAFILALACILVVGSPAHAGKGHGSGGGGGGGGGGASSVPGVVTFTGNTASPGVWVLDPVGSAPFLVTSPGAPAGYVASWVALDASRGHANAPITILARRDLGPAGTPQPPTPPNERSLVAIRADGSGTPVSLLTVTEPAQITGARFSHDGTAVAILGHDGTAPITYTIQTADVVRDTNGEVIGLGALVTAYEGSAQVGGLDFTFDDGAIVLSASGDLWSVDLATLVVSRLTSTSEKEMWPRCSPVDSRVTYELWPDGSADGRGGLVATLDPANGAVRVLTTKKNGGTSAGAWLSFPNWSPDGTKVLYHGNDSQKSDLWWIAADASGKAANLTADGTTVDENYPAWGW